MISSKPDSTKQDSIVTPVASVPQTENYSIFKNHLLPANDVKPVVRTPHNDFAIFWILFILYALFVWLYNFNYKIIKKIVDDFFSLRKSENRTGEHAAIGNRVSIFLSVFFIATLAILFGKTLEYYSYNLGKNSFSDELIIAGLVIVIYALKIGIVKLSGIIFKLKKEANEYISRIILFYNTLGIFLLPLIILLVFFKQVSPLIFIYLGLFMTTAFVSIRIINGLITTLSSSKISKFYLFIYLCALEILPTALVLRLILTRVAI